MFHSYSTALNFSVYTMLKKTMTTLKDIFFFLYTMFSRPYSPKSIGEKKKKKKKKEKDIFVTKQCKCKVKRKVVKSKVSPVK